MEGNIIVSVGSPDSLLTWQHRAALAEILWPPSPEREAREYSRINGSRGADARLIRCAGSPPAASPPPLTGGRVRSTSHCFLLGLMPAQRGMRARSVKALVGNCCGPNLGLAFLSISVSLRHVSVAADDGTHTLDIR